MKILCTRCRQREANVVATGRWLCWPCFRLELNTRPEKCIGEDALGVTSLRTLDFVKEYLCRVGIAPTLEEIAQNVHVSSRSVALFHLERLAQARKIRRFPVGRGIVLEEDGD